MSWRPKGESEFTDPVVIRSETDKTTLRITQTGSGNALVVEDSTNPDATPFVITADGRVIAGYSAGVSVIGSNCGVQVHGTTGLSRFASMNWSSIGSEAPGISIAKSSSGTIGTQGIVAVNDTLGSLVFAGSDGSNFIHSAFIACYVDGTPGTNDMPGRLIFSTTADGASSPTERMRITNAGNVGIGTTAPSVPLDVVSDVNAIGYRVRGRSSDNIASIQFTDNASSAQSAAIQVGSNYLANIVGSTERMRIDNLGNVGIGTSSPTASLDVASTSQAAVRATSTATNSSLSIRRHNGTLASPTTVANGDSIGAIAANGYDGSAYVLASRIQLGAEGSISTGVVPGNIRFESASSAGVLTERMRITSAGRVGIGTSSPTATLDVSGGIAAAGNLDTTSSQAYLPQVNLTNTTNDANAPYVQLRKARGTSVVQSGDYLGSLQWVGYDGSTYLNAAAIMANVDGSPGTNDMPGRLAFFTTADGASSSTERMRIDNAGLITGTGTSLGAWTAYTPTLGGTGWAIGNGTATGYYCQIGKIVHCRGNFTFGSTSTFGASALATMTYPVTAATGAGGSYGSVGMAFDFSAALRYSLWFTQASSTVVNIRYANGAVSDTSSTVPFTWATSDTLTWAFSYEAA